MKIAVRIPYPLKTEAEKLAEYGIIHDALVSIYGPDSLTVDTLRVLFESGMSMEQIKNQIAYQFGLLMQGL